MPAKARQAARSSMHACDSGASTPQLRCWQDERGWFHLACDDAGGKRLLDAVRRLLDASAPERIAIPLTASPLPADRNPAGGAAYTFLTLHLERVDDPTRLVFFYVGKVDATNAELLLGSNGLVPFMEWSEGMADGSLFDFCVGGRPHMLSARRWRQLRTLDRRSAALCFWARTAVSPLAAKD